MSISFVDPVEKTPLKLLPDGSAYVSENGTSYEVKDGIPVFSQELYADNFGDQWRDFPETQVDSEGADQVSEDRLTQTFGFDLSELKGKTILEIGSGAGRFSEILLKYGADLYTSDASHAIKANRDNNEGKGTCTFFQASVYDLPLEERQFDIVLCIGVIQHLPDIEKGIKCLAQQVKPGGTLVIDHYRWDWYRRMAPRYLIGRRITCRLQPATNRKIAKAYVASWWWARNVFKSKAVRSVVTTISPLSPIYYYGDVYRNSSLEQLREMAVLDTNDFISARYDKGLTRNQLTGILERTDAQSIEVFTDRELMRQYGDKRTAGLVARATYA